jgi:hypothetical protein
MQFWSANYEKQNVSVDRMVDNATPQFAFAGGAVLRAVFINGGGSVMRTCYGLNGGNPMAVGTTLVATAIYASGTSEHNGRFCSMGGTPGWKPDQCQR